MRFGIQFGELGDFTRKQAMGCEVDDAIILEPSLLNAGLSRLRTKDDVRLGRLDARCHPLQLIGGLGKRVECSNEV